MYYNCTVNLALSSDFGCYYKYNNGPWVKCEQPEGMLFTAVTFGSNSFTSICWHVIIASRIVSYRIAANTDKDRYGTCPMAFTVTPYWLIFQLPHWHSIRESSTPPPRHVLFWIARPYVTPVLQELHRLPVAERIQYMLCLMVHKSLLEHTPVYMSDLQMPMYPLDLHCVLRRLATSSCRRHVDEPATGLSLSPHREHGTRCRHS